MGKTLPWLAAAATALAFAAPVEAQQASRRGAIKMDTLTVEGELQKPQASYIIQRSNQISLSDNLKGKAPAVTPRIAESLADDLFDPRP